MPATRDEISRTFLELVFRFGYRRTTVGDVARELHISKKTIYQHFPGKEQLLRGALELAAREQRARVESLLTETTALGRLRQMIGVALADARAGFADDAGQKLPEFPELTAEVNDLVFVPMLRDVLEQGVADGEFGVSDLDTTAAFLAAIGTEAVRQIRDDPQHDPEAALLDAARRLVAPERSPS